jgi:hypothetical protein
MFSSPFCLLSLSPITSLLAPRGPDAVPSKDYSRWPPWAAGFFVKGERPRTHSSKKKTMKTYANSDSRLQNRTAQSFQNQLHRIDFRLRFYNRQLSTAGVLDLLYYEAPRLWELAEVVGQWVWIEFNEPPPHEITAKLSEFGFHWNRKRQLWQHPCGQFVSATPRDPRQKYHAYFPADAQAA